MPPMTIMDSSPDTLGAEPGRTPATMLATLVQSTSSSDGSGAGVVGGIALRFTKKRFARSTTYELAAESGWSNDNEVSS